MIGIVDYNAGNITSVERALKSLGIEYILSKTDINENGFEKEFEDKKEAMKREWQFKQYTHAEKEKIIGGKNGKN